MNENYAGDLAPRDAWELLQREPTAALVDVRTDAEWRFVGRPDLTPLGRALQFVPWQLFPDLRRNEDFVGETSGLGLSKDQPLLFICRSGARSRHAAIAMTAAGYGPCYNVAEGFEGDKDAEGHRGRIGGWKVAGLPWDQD